MNPSKFERWHRTTEDDFPENLRQVLLNSLKYLSFFHFELKIDEILAKPFPTAKWHAHVVQVVWFTAFFHVEKALGFQGRNEVDHDSFPPLRSPKKTIFATVLNSKSSHSKIFAVIMEEIKSDYQYVYQPGWVVLSKKISCSRNQPRILNCRSNAGPEVHEAFSWLQLKAKKACAQTKVM